MKTVEVAPLQLLPVEFTPVDAVVKAAGRTEKSELFPALGDQSPYDYGPLGDYESGFPRAVHPLGPIYQDLSTARVAAKTEETDRGQQTILAIEIQQAVLKSIHNAHLNLLAVGTTPQEAVQTIVEHIDRQDAYVRDSYERQSLDIAAGLAELGTDGNEPEWLDDAPASWQRVMSSSTTHSRLRCLQFEWLSAHALLSIVKNSPTDHLETVTIP